LFQRLTLKSPEIDANLYQVGETQLIKLGLKDAQENYELPRSIISFIALDNPAVDLPEIREISIERSDAILKIGQSDLQVIDRAGETHLLDASVIEPAANPFRVSSLYLSKLGDVMIAGKNGYFLIRDRNSLGKDICFAN